MHVLSSTYFHTLATALIGSDTLRWYSASEAERAEVRKRLMTAGLTGIDKVFPTEATLARHEQRRRHAVRLLHEAAAAIAAPLDAPDADSPMKKVTRAKPKTHK
jgi:hypothetical protein